MRRTCALANSRPRNPRAAVTSFNNTNINTTNNNDNINNNNSNNSNSNSKSKMPDLAESNHGSSASALKQESAVRKM